METNEHSSPTAKPSRHEARIDELWKQFHDRLCEKHRDVQNTDKARRGLASWFYSKGQEDMLVFLKELFPKEEIIKKLYGG